MYTCKSCKTVVEGSGNSQFGNKCKYCILNSPFFGLVLSEIVSARVDD
jgi:hypothetical protein